MQKIGCFGVVKGHSRSLAMSPFDRVHVTSCWSLIEAMQLPCTVFGIQGVVKIRQLQPITTAWAISHDPMYSHIDTIPACDRWTERQTDTRPQLIPR